MRNNMSEEDKAVLDAQFLQQLNKREFAHYIEKQLDVSLDEMKERVTQYAQARIQMQVEREDLGVLCFRIMQTQWQVCYEICRRIEGSPLQLMVGGKGFDRKSKQD